MLQQNDDVNGNNAPTGLSNPIDKNLGSDTDDALHMDVENEESNDVPSTIMEEADDGKHILYPDLMTKPIMKTTDRLVDDILCDLVIRLDVDNNDLSHVPQPNTILNASPLQYSKLRQYQRPLVFGSTVNQVVLQTKFEYGSVSCPQHNKLNVIMGVLYDTSSHEEMANRNNNNHIVVSPIYHLKVTIKTRSQLELYKRHAGISQFFPVDDLHVFDKQDLLTFDPMDPLLVDHAIYVSPYTNKLILIEIFNPEFDSDQELQSLTNDKIKERYLDTCQTLPDLDAANIPTQLDCINTMFKLFKGPLARHTAADPLKVIPQNNVALNCHMNPQWLTEKYGFQLLPNKDKDDEKDSILEYNPPDLLDYVHDWKVRKQRESYIRKCLHLIFLSKLLINNMDPKEKQTLSIASKAFKFFNSYDVSTTTKPLFQLLGGNKASFNLNSDQSSPLDINYHFINLSTSYYYPDRDIISNYETLTKLDQSNTGVYFDALSFIANRKGSYQLLGYCGKQNVVGQEALDSALMVFKIDPSQIDPVHGLDEKMILSLYQHEQVMNSDSNYLSYLKNALRVLAKYKKSEFLTFYVNYEPYKLLSQAYSELEIDESVDDDIVQTAYTIKINDSPGLKLECTRALYTIALHKRSMSLFNFLLESCPLFVEFYGPQKYTYQEALNMIQVNENANDELILKIFQEKWDHEPIREADQLLNLKSALSKICLESNSKLISNFIETGLIDPNCLPPENWPTGLNNIGNTCYLNSLLQYYFAIKPVREYICHYANTFRDFEQEDCNACIERRIGGRQVSPSEVERSIQFTYQLRDLFQKMIYSNIRCVTPTQELAYLAFAPSNVEVEFESSVVPSNNQNVDIQETGMSDTKCPKEVTMEVDDTPQTVDEGTIRIPVEEGENEVDGVERDIDMTTEEDGTSTKDDNVKHIKDDISTSTKVAKISLDQLENTLEIGRQQDVTECIGNVLYQLESASKPISLDESHEQDDLIKQLFYGKTKQDIIPINDSNEVRVKYERFLSLMVTISDHPKNIYDALDAYFTDEYLNLEEYGDVRRTLCITEFPSILQIQIQRVYYDRERFMPFKSIEPLPFPQTIYMDRYADIQDINLIDKKKETQTMKQKLKQLQLRQKELLTRDKSGLSRKDSYMETIKLLKSNLLSHNTIKIPAKGISNEMAIAQLQKKIDSINDELAQLYEEISQLEEKIDHQFDGFQSMAYSLFAVFIHRGEASYGHYWVYIKDFKNSGIWRKYNDETVSEVREDEVFNFLEGNTATPYFLVLIRKDKENDIEPLKRIIESEILD